MITKKWSPVRGSLKECFYGSNAEFTVGFISHAYCSSPLCESSCSKVGIFKQSTVHGNITSPRHTSRLGFQSSAPWYGYIKVQHLNQLAEMHYSLRSDKLWEVALRKSSTMVAVVLATNDGSKQTDSWAQSGNSGPAHIKNFLACRPHRLD